MGTLNFTVCAPGRSGRHSRTDTVMGKVRTSGAATTSAVAANIADVAAATLAIRPGEFFVGVASISMWVNPYGTATVGTGIYFGSGIQTAFEYDPDGDANGAKATASVSAIDV